MGEIRIVGPGKTRGYPYPVCKKSLYCIATRIYGAPEGTYTMFFFDVAATYLVVMAPCYVLPSTYHVVTTTCVVPSTHYGVPTCTTIILSWSCAHLISQGNDL